MNETALLPGHLHRAEDARRLLAADESEERASAPIPETSCTEDPSNHRLNLISGAFGWLAGQLGSPGLVLPWMLAGIGASATVIGLLVPMKVAGSLVARLVAPARIRRQPRRKWIWVGAALFQALMLASIGASALILPPEMAGPLTVLALVAIGMAGGVGSVAYQDVVGKTIPAGRRARLLAGRALAGGGLLLVAAAAFRELIGYLVSSQITLPMVAVPLVGAAALAWALAAVFFAAIGERPGVTQGGRSLLGKLNAGLGLMGTVPGYRRFVLARGLLVAVELAAPFLALQATRLYGNGAGPLSLYLVAFGLVPLVAGPLWSRWALASSRTAMAAAGLLALLAGVLALGVVRVPVPDGTWAYVGVFLLAGAAETGLRLSRKSYLLAGADDTERPLCAAVANTVAAAVALAGGGLGVLVDYSAPSAAIGILIAVAALGTLAALTLPPAAAPAGVPPSPPPSR